MTNGIKNNQNIDYSKTFHQIIDKGNYQEARYVLLEEHTDNE